MRLIDLGIVPYLVASSINVVIAQRLIRLLCEKCKTRVSLDKVVCSEPVKSQLQNSQVYQAKGCEACRGTGYRGRTAIHEFMLVDDDMRELITRSVSLSEIKKAALAKGMIELQDSGFEKVKQGLTTIEEILRVTRS